MAGMASIIAASTSLASSTSWTSSRLLKSVKQQVFFVPGAHDVTGDNGKLYLKRFGSVTVLNGHIHQTMKKVEGHATFHTAMSTAFPQPEPGKAPKPGPLKVEAGRLREYLGITDVNYVESNHSLAVVDSTLG